MTAEAAIALARLNEPGGGRRVLYVDLAYTHEIVRQKGHENFFETRHSAGFFDRVWGVHPVADVAGSRARDIEIIPFSPRQTIIEGVSRSRKWPRLLAPLDFFLSQRKLARLLTETILREKIDLIVANDPFYGGVLGSILRGRTGRPLAIGIYANYDFAYETFAFIAMPRLMPWFWLQNIVAFVVLRSCDFVIGGSRNYLEWALRHGARPDSGAVIPIARNIESCHLVDPAERPSHEELFRALGIPLWGRHMIMVSRLIPVKFAEDGIRAMIRAAEIDAEAIGIIAGDGALRPELEKLVAAAGLSDRILFIGHVSQEKLSVILPQCVTVSPLTGMALVEGGLSGSPAVAYDADWQGEFIEDGVNGFVVPLWDHRRLGEKAAELLGDEALRARMSRAMRQMALYRADRNEIARIEHEVFARAIASRGGGRIQSG